MNRIDALEEAKTLSLAGSYRDALGKIEALLALDPRDVEALRLKGNVIELEIMDRESNLPAKYVHSDGFRKARACYEQILLLEPRHPGALVDLGTHWKNLGDYDRALEYFDRALEACGASDTGNSQEKIEALQGEIEIFQAQGRTQEVTDLEAKLLAIEGRR